MLFLFIIMILLFSQGLKFSKKNNNSKNDQNSDLLNKNNSSIDFEKLKGIIENSNNIDIDVFVAISILHKNYIMQYKKDSDALPEDQQKKFFDQKNKEFFKTIKYSEAQYNSYIGANIDTINEYIASHKEISEFLTGLN
jgi:hypothetical protein